MISLRGLNAGRVLIGGLGLVLVGMASVGGGYVTRSHKSTALDMPPAAEGVDIVRGVVQSVSPDSISLLTESGPVMVRVAPGTKAEAIRRTGLASVQPGDWVNAGGVRHDQTIFALTALVVIPAATLGDSR